MASMHSTNISFSHHEFLKHLGMKITGQTRCEGISGDLCPDSLSKRVSYGVRLLRALFHWVSKTFEEGAGTVSAAHVIYSLPVPKGKIFLILSNHKGFFPLRSSVSQPSNKQHSGKCGLILVISPQCAGGCWEVPQCHLFFRLKKHVVLSLCSQNECSSLSILVASAELPEFYWC